MHEKQSIPIALTKTDPAPLNKSDPPSEKGFFPSKENASEERGSVVVSAKAGRNGMRRGTKAGILRCMGQSGNVLQRKKLAFRRINGAKLF